MDRMDKIGKRDRDEGMWVQHGLAWTTVNILINNIWSKHGLWSKIITDQGPQFAGQDMTELFKKLRIQSAVSTAYHPQTDGETEHYNQELEQFLQVFINYC